MTDKVSLDPYRLQSRKILACIKDALPADVQKVEKASIDEVFLDLSSQVRSILLERFPELSNPPPYDDPTEKLPLPSIAALDWQTDALIDLNEEQEAIDPDWDDVAILIGSEIVRKVRSEVRQKLGRNLTSRLLCAIGQCQLLWPVSKSRSFETWVESFIKHEGETWPRHRVLGLQHHQRYRHQRGKLKNSDQIDALGQVLSPYHKFFGASNTMVANIRS